MTMIATRAAITMSDARNCAAIIARKSAMIGGSTVYAPMSTAATSISGASMSVTKSIFLPARQKSCLNTGITTTTAHSHEHLSTAGHRILSLGKWELVLVPQADYTRNAERVLLGSFSNTRS